MGAAGRRSEKDQLQGLTFNSFPVAADRVVVAWLPCLPLVGLRVVDARSGVVVAWLPCPWCAAFNSFPVAAINQAIP